MTAVGARTSPVIIFDGQSLNDNPLSFGTRGTGYAFLICTNLGIAGSDHWYLNPAAPSLDNERKSPLQAWIGGIAWAQLDESFTTRVVPYLKCAPVVMYHMMGGTTDIALGSPGTVVYDRMSALAVTATGAGASFVVAATISNSSIFSAPQNVERASANALIVADADGSFDDVVDLGTDPGFENCGTPASPGPYFTDATHWNATGRNAAVAIAEPQIRLLLGL